ncbi:5,10-methylenetetrahydrofolate reductase [Solidesulfovibrio carbinoliphilus subsp. oakridgensis]|uniref:Methylenetetrahydrofolate reductase n=1 Tax=Solidesulfovibrio carbinoliphilus subsp. oakridgensis TaxID=694327 RepID=G7Q5P3_9BACT|nr:methylenetetrahydrofolate reductase [NAD(P)H] [Solidesulfovibrio carbinoliphilus]EHJ49602.1 5,10-methylenetetrahydrofolate reductase [Solidesulfovibrio carbinoliphilus subsp. oakridgensis]
MRIGELIEAKRPFVSLEFFPPKEREAWAGFFDVVERLLPVRPLFVSVTYGAGGSTHAHTLEIVSRLKTAYGLEPMAHLTCVGASREKIRGFLDGLAAAGVDNVLALRGDPPKGQEQFVPDSEDFQHASDLVAFIRREYPALAIGVAGYPECHPEAPSARADLDFLRQKIALGGDFTVTQLFFDNDCYFAFVDKVRGMGITVPIVPGVLPVMSLASVKRLSSLCGASLPPAYLAALEAADAAGGPAAVAEVGIAHARKQAQDLIDRGAPGVHLYTLNKAEAVLSIVSGLTM